MKEKGNKILGEERRQLILSWLLTETEPLSGNELAERTNVSRQVIVQDISLLKAKGEAIIATARGYVYLKENNKTAKIQEVIAVCHKMKDTALELYTLVDNGVSIRDVMVEHPVYGDLTGSLMLHNRRDVDMFLAKMEQTDASLLSDLTGGIHLHTVESDTKKQIDEALDVLRTKGILLD